MPSPRAPRRPVAIGRGGCRRSRRATPRGRREAGARGDSLTLLPRRRRGASGSSKPDPALARLDELQEVLDLRERLELRSRALHRLRHVQLRSEHEPVRALQLAHDLVRKSAALEPDAVEPIQLHRVTDRLDERRNVLRHARAAADERVSPDLHELMHRRKPGKDRAILDRHVTGKLRRIRDDDAVANVTIVREMHVRHQERSLPDRRLERLRGPAVYRRVLTDTRTLTDFDPRLLALELKILRVAPEDRTDPNAHVRREADVSIEHGTRLDRTAVVDEAVVADNGIRPDRDVVAKLGPRRDDRGGVNARHDARRVAHRSRTIAAISASATTSPSTFATPFMRQMRPRICTTSSSNRS